MVVLPPKSRAAIARSSTASSTANALFKSINRTSIQLQQLVEKFRADSDHNFDKAEHFHERRLNGKRMPSAMRRARRLSRPRYRALQAQLAERATALDQAAGGDCSRSGPLHQTTHEEKWGLNLFRLMATWLIEAHSAGRSDRPEFAEMRDMAKDVTDAIQRGNPFRGYRDEPEKKARLEMLVAALDRP